MLSSSGTRNRFTSPAYPHQYDNRVFEPIMYCILSAPMSPFNLLTYISLHKLKLSWDLAHVRVKHMRV